MGRHTLNGNPPIDVILRRSTRAKRLSLRVSRLDGRVTLTLPQHAPEQEGIAFLQSREAWLRGHLSEVPDVAPLRIGDHVLYEGALVPVVGATGRRAALTSDGLSVPVGRAVGPTAKALLMAKARDALVAASDHYAGQVGRSYGRLTLRDTRSRWGSCTSAGNLMYSWRLIMAPPEILQYVAAHEVAHLIEMNHSDAFWAIVADIFPDYVACRRWLRDHGERLHQVSFVH